MPGSTRSQLMGGMRCVLVGLCAAIPFQHALAQSAVLARAHVPHGSAISARGELHDMKLQLQRKSNCEKRDADATNAQSAASTEAAALPTIVICGSNEPERGDEIPQAKAVSEAIIGAKSKPLELGRKEVLSGAPPPGAGGAWTDPGNLLFWLR